MAKLYLGCSGFSYNHWRGNFYPVELPTRRWFEHYHSVFNTVELNVTFYRIPTVAMFRHWYEESGQSFSFAVKGSRYITHIKRLHDIEGALAKFFAPTRELHEKLQVVLWQLPPQFKVDMGRLERFLDLVAPYHGRHALELRNESWLTDAVVSLCRDRNVSLCMADHPSFIDAPPVTADFVYIRRHGMEGSYNGFYTNEQLVKDVVRIRKYLSRGLDVYIYFNNDAGGAAPQNARDLATMLQAPLDKE
ncbi:DUF72 domain-containing protein [Geomonas sp. Red69]|uniref:DUF72 domain-containing protein n=1 Tax=Geomonas diazotrophica TaxID=2843197 RepID=A0ABX8JPM0_9BACT|nr:MULTISPECIES: DUF72 domain-containing protein [Geomonas]MBU5637233.1 DUF72 domain-containing protein [Geomonas diazotrophica]QWV99527.1 DUF72 domain-containing protein [Geomonas nitrogeniifigens]QXE88702.1 DUF72 domain-containing protein [Geomonas nitrogeniifigens]